MSRESKMPKTNFEGLKPFRLYAGAEIKRHSNRDYYIFSDSIDNLVNGIDGTNLVNGGGTNLVSGPNVHPACNLLTSLNRKNFGANTGFSVFSEMKIGILHKYTDIKYIRKVIFPDGCHVYVGKQNYLADKIICGEPELIDRTALLKYVSPTILLDETAMFQYIMADRNILRNLNTDTFTDDFIVKCLTNDINTMFLIPRVTEQHMICTVYNPDLRLSKLTIKGKRKNQAWKLFTSEHILKILLERNSKVLQCLGWIPRQNLTDTLRLTALPRIPIWRLGVVFGRNKPHFFNEKIMTIFLVTHPEAILFLADNCYQFINPQFASPPQEYITQMIRALPATQHHFVNARFRSLIDTLSDETGRAI